MLIQPRNYDQTSVAELLRAAGEGLVGIDLRWVRSILSRPDEAIPAILEYGQNPPEDARVQIDIDLLNLLTQLPEADCVDYLAQLLREGLTELPDSLMFLAKRAGAAALEPLLDVYADLDEADAGEVSFLLAGLNVRDERLLNLFIERLEFDMEDGAILLGLYGDPAAIPHLERYSAEVGKNRDLDFALEQLRNPQPAAADDSPLDFLEDYDETGMPEFEALSDAEILQLAVEHEDEEVQLGALEVLEDLDLESSLRPAGLIALAEGDATAAVRAAAFRALARMNRHKEVREAAGRVLDDTNAPKQVRAGALITLLPKHVDEARIRTLVAEFLADPDSRPDAVQAMWRSELGDYHSGFGALMDDPSLEVRRQAARGAGVTQDTTAVGKLRGLLKDSGMRRDALFAYALAVPSDVSPSRMRSLFTRIEKEAGGLDSDEGSSVGMALDMRLTAMGKPAIFFPDDDEMESDS
jgi:hypothetical protein